MPLEIIIQFLQVVRKQREWYYVCSLIEGAFWQMF